MNPGMNPLETLGQTPPKAGGLRESMHPGRQDTELWDRTRRQIQPKPPTDLSDVRQRTDPLLQAPVAPEKALSEASPYSARVTGPVRFINRLLVTWQLDSKFACVLLGFELSESDEVIRILQGRTTLRGRDAKDRIAHLFRIRSLLASLFRDEAVENEWLREPRDILEGRSPMDLLMEGSMENLLLVREAVEVVTGR